MVIVGIIVALLLCAVVALLAVLLRHVVHAQDSLDNVHDGFRRVETTIRSDANTARAAIDAGVGRMEESMHAEVRGLRSALKEDVKDIEASLGSMQRSLVSELERAREGIREDVEGIGASLGERVDAVHRGVRTEMDRSRHEAAQFNAELLDQLRSSMRGNSESMTRALDEIAGALRSFNDTQTRKRSFGALLTGAAVVAALALVVIAAMLIIGGRPTRGEDAHRVASADRAGDAETVAPLVAGAPERRWEQEILDAQLAHHPPVTREANAVAGATRDPVSRSGTDWNEVVSDGAVVSTPVVEPERETDGAPPDPITPDRVSTVEGAETAQIIARASADRDEASSPVHTPPAEPLAASRAPEAGGGARAELRSETEEFETRKESTLEVAADPFVDEAPAFEGWEEPGERVAEDGPTIDRAPAPTSWWDRLATPTDAPGGPSEGTIAYEPTPAQESITPPEPPLAPEPQNPPANAQPTPSNSAVEPALSQSEPQPEPRLSTPQLVEQVETASWVWGGFAEAPDQSDPWTIEECEHHLDVLGRLARGEVSDDVGQRLVRLAQARIRGAVVRSLEARLGDIQRELVVERSKIGAPVFDERQVERSVSDLEGELARIDRMLSDYIEGLPRELRAQWSRDFYDVRRKQAQVARLAAAVARESQVAEAGPR